MNKVKFISIKYFKENTTVEYNVDDDKITPTIYKAQDIYIQQSLGSEFYNHLKDAIVNNTLTTDEDILLRTYIQPCLNEYTLLLLIPIIQFNLTNKSVLLRNDNNSQPSTLEDIKFLRQSVRDMAEFYLKRLNRYLEENDNLFPKYYNADNDDNLPPTQKSYFNGVWLPRSGSDRCTWDELNKNRGDNT